MKFLNVLNNYDPLLENHLNSATIFQGTLATLQNDLIKTLPPVVKREVGN